jgi:hypothetical protein
MVSPLVASAQHDILKTSILALDNLNLQFENTFGNFSHGN